MATKTKEKTQAGEFLRSVLTTRGVTARTAAENLGVPVEHLYRVINSHQRLSDGLIVRLGAAFPEIPVSDWEMRRIADREAAIRRGIRAHRLDTSKALLKYSSSADVREWTEWDTGAEDGRNTGRSRVEAEEKSSRTIMRAACPYNSWNSHCTRPGLRGQTGKRCTAMSKCERINRYDDEHNR